MFKCKLSANPRIPIASFFLHHQLSCSTTRPIFDAGTNELSQKLSIEVEDGSSSSASQVARLVLKVCPLYFFCDQTATSQCDPSKFNCRISMLPSMNSSINLPSLGKMLWNTCKTFSFLVLLPVLHFRRRYSCLLSIKLPLQQTYA